MKDFMINMMAAMTPFMKPLMWLGVAAAVLGFVLLIAHVGMRANTGGWILLVGRVAFGMAIFFFGCQIAGYLLWAAPGINFGDFSKMEFNIVPFWKIGAGWPVVSRAMVCRPSVLTRDGLLARELLPDGGAKFSSSPWA